ncbi:MAG: energy transducer TonB [Betaproteobacteria bacterium]
MPSVEWPLMKAMPARKIVPLPRRGQHTRHAPWSAAAAQFDRRISELERHITAIDRRFVALAIRVRIEGALLVSLMLHVLIIGFVTFRMPEKKPPPDLNQPLEVVLVNAKSTAKPPQPDAFAQANLDGGGNTDAARRAKSPFPVREQEKPEEMKTATRRVEPVERDTRQMMTRPAAEPKAETAPPRVAEPQSEAPVAPDASVIVHRGLEIARLEAQISRDWDSYQKRPRRKFIGARTQEFRFARYIEDWRLKIERIGELNYPQAAREQKAYGSLVVTVSIKANGALEKVEINRPSGWKMLDEAALHIVRLAAPFAPFPNDIALDTDILSITRTWTFTRSDQLISE